MSIALSDYVKDFFPPDYSFEGGDIEAALLKGDVAALVDAEVENPGLEAVYVKDRERKYPSREIPLLGEDAILLLRKGLDCFRRQFADKWPMSGYEVAISIHPEHQCGVVYFFPKIEDFVDSIPFEVSAGGIWKNGVGMSYFLSLVDFSLIDKVAYR